MKSTIQAEAEKAAKKIREALEEFGEATGFEAQVINVDWRSAYTWRPLESTGSTDMNAYVEFVVSGFEVKA